MAGKPKSKRKRRQRNRTVPARPRGWEGKRTAEQPHWAPWKYRTLATALSVAAIGELLGLVLAVLAVPSAVSQAQAFLAAPVCAVQDTTPDCRLRQTEQVRWVEVSHGKNPQATVDLWDQRTGGEQEVPLAGIDPVGDRLSGGDLVEVTSWHGQPVMLRYQGAQQNADSQPTDGQAYTLNGALALALLLPATALTARRAWRRGEPRRSPAPEVILLLGAVAAAIGIFLLRGLKDIYLGAGLDAIILVLVGLLLRLHWIRRQRRAALAAPA